MVNRILLVDNVEDDIRKLREVLVNHSGVEVVYVDVLDDAISELMDTENPYCAVISNFDMEGLNGGQFLRLLKGDFDGKSISNDAISLDDIFVHDPELGEYIEEHFTLEEYRNFVFHLKTRYSSSSRQIGMLKQTLLLLVYSPL